MEKLSISALETRAKEILTGDHLTSIVGGATEPLKERYYATCDRV